MPGSAYAYCEGLIVVGCSRSKTVTSAPVPALELYQGWCMPKLRDRIGHLPQACERTMILSARHGLIAAHAPVTTYDQAMTPERASQLRPACATALSRQLAAHPSNRALLLAEPLYLDALGPLPVTEVHTVTRPLEEWDDVEQTLADWGWM